MDRYEPGIRYPRGRDDWMRDHPLASRLLIMIVGFAVLVPIAIVLRTSQGNVVHSSGLPGAVMAAEPVVVPSTPTSTTVLAAVAVPAPTTPAPVATPAPTTAAPATTAATVAAVQQAPATTAKKQVATTPAPTSPPTTKAKPTTTAAPTTAAPTTPPPTEPPTTEAPVVAPPENTYTKGDVEAIIRSVFPAEEADEAVRIATRESNLIPTVRNWCCYGLFQIYFEMNKKTLAPLGITSAEQLYDPVVNTQAAYVMFQRSGWGPWR